MAGYWVSQAVCAGLVVLVAAVALRQYRRQTRAIADAVVARLGADRAADAEQESPDDAPPPSGAGEQARELLPVLLKLRGVRWRAEVDGTGFRVVIVGKRRRQKPTPRLAPA